MKNMNWTKWLVTLLMLTLCTGTGFAGNEPGEEGYIDTWADDDPDHLCGKITDINCVSFYISTGPLHNRVNLPGGKIGFLSDLPSPTHSTPQALRAIGGLYGIQRVVGNKVTIINRSQKKIDFVFPEGSAVASPDGEASTWNATLHKVDSEGSLSYDLHTYKGLERIRFSAETNSPNYLRMIDLRTTEGQIYRADEFGMSYIYDEEGIIRQVMAPTRMLDFVTIDPYEYEVRFYEPQDVSLGTNGLYDVLEGASPFEFYTVANPDTTNAYNRLNITRTVGGTERTFAFTYAEVQHMWIGTEDGGQTFKQSTMEWDAAKENCVRTKKWFSDGESPVAKWTKRIIKQPWGQALMEKEDHISPTLSRTNVYTYYSDESESNHYSKVASAQMGNGTWWTRDYDDQKRMSFDTLSWKDVELTTNAALAKAVTYDYTPHESADVLLSFDTRTRTKTETIEGIVVKKTFYTYKTNSVGGQVHITEQCAAQNGSYGDAANLRTTKTYFPPYDGTDFQSRLNAGRVKTVEAPDGQLKTYEYALGDLAMNYTDPSASSFAASTNGLDWQVSVIHGTTNSPNGIANKTVKKVTVKDKYSNTALRETYVYTGSGYERIKWTAKQFDVYGHALEIWQSDGTQESGYWGTGCCGKDNGTDRQGIETAYTYDLNKQMISATKQTTNDTAGVTQEYTYDAKGRRLSAVRSAIGITALTNSATFDMLGRKLQKNFENGTSAQWSYNDANHTVTETRPGGATRITSKQADGKPKSITGTAVVHETVDYGVNSDGTQWVKKYIGSDGTSSAMWEKTTKDLFGRTVKIEKPAFGGGVLTTKHTNNTKGLLTRTEQWVGDDLETVQVMEYDELGRVTRNGIDVDQNDELTLASMDRINDSSTSFVKESGEWYNERIQIIYPNDDSSVALTNSILRNRLTGLGTASDLGVLISETVSRDRFGNETSQKRFVDRDAKTVTTLADTPSSTQDVVQVTINGLLQSVKSSQSVENLFSYDSLERRTGTTDPRTGTTVLHYNELNQIEWAMDAASNKTWVAYDPDTGRKAAQTNALGHTTLYTYNTRGQVTEVGGSSQYPVEYGYDNFGRMTDLYTLRGATNGWDRTQWLYDSATGLMTNKLYADNKGPSYTYTPSGKLQTRTWARTAGVSPALPLTTTYSYDTVGSLTNTVYSDDTPSVSLEYNRLGQKTQVIDASGTNTFTYNGVLQLTGEANVGHASSLSRLHDSLGRASGITHNSDYAVSYAFDDLGRFSSVSSSVASVSSMFDYSYLEDSSLISGYTSTAGGSPALSVSYDFENNRNAKTSVLNEFGTNLVSQFDYTYDPLMRRTKRTDVRNQGSEVSTNDFGYNARSELTSAIMGTNDFDYAYDSIGNRVDATSPSRSLSYTANALNQYVSTTNSQLQTSNSFTYDSDGNLLSDGVTTYSWNGENRLTQISNATTVVTFKYDYRGRRFEKTVDATNTTRFVYDGWNLIQELNQQSEIENQKCYVWGLDLSQSLQGAGGVGGLLSVIRGGANSPSEPYSPCYDANGNVTEYVSTSGVAVAHYEYNPYGGLISSSGSMADDFAFRFSTKYFDAETSLYYYGFRYYNPEMGRWLNRDPIEEQGGVNLYVFCQNDLIGSVDMLGMITSCISSFSSASQRISGGCSAGSAGTHTIGTLIQYYKETSPGRREFWETGLLCHYDLNLTCNDACNGVYTATLTSSEYVDRRAHM